MKTDKQLKSDVEAELEWNPSVNANAVGVEVKFGIVTLSGHLGSFAEKLAAQKSVQRVAGVNGVAVEIDVKIPGSSLRSDTDIALAATHCLQWNATVPPGQVKVSVEKGWITLSGELEWGYQRAAAESSVRNLTGVKGIINLVQMRSQNSTDGVKTKIEAALKRAAHLDAEAISVSVDGGRVVLEGTIHSYSERRIVEDAVWAAPGVTVVVDNTRIAA